MLDDSFIFGLGFFAQGLFSARLLVQWFLSEKAKKVVSPDLFWQLSLVASILLLIYGILRKDLVIVGGQFVSFYIYLRNLQLKNVWQSFPWWLHVLALSAPVLAILFLFITPTEYNIRDMMHNPLITAQLYTVGAIGQFIFTFRFIYQLIYSERHHESLLPPMFWVISITGSLIIIGYAIVRRDPVIILGQIFGTLIYSRNLILYYTQRVRDREAPTDE
ncbi:lipid-A-disaccharide synthase N-terminal domain-containing protein [Anaerophaga thermohalophila]|uniref:lipid-A-disaccharide synthase N-terminal domain-containing protein n=1 Tax=Anaerophaga thermohalophila TaxID=177400 RepID=UPI000237D54B|nr:lipid-A-disaccharide synthase N-terminal domain-containing protein [Anaerophaga thermohalophila]